MFFSHVVVYDGPCITYYFSEITGLLGGFSIVTVGTFYINGVDFYCKKRKLDKYE